MIGKTSGPVLAVPRHVMSRFPRAVTAPKSSIPSGLQNSHHVAASSRVMSTEVKEEIVIDPVAAASSQGVGNTSSFVVPTELDEEVSAEVERLREVAAGSKSRLEAIRERHQRIVVASMRSKELIWSSVNKSLPSVTSDAAEQHRPTETEGSNNEQVDLVDL